MKLKLQKDMNRHIHKDNYELLVSREELLMGIIQELESELQAKDKMLAQFHKDKQVEQEKDEPSSTKGLHTVTEVCHENDPLCYFSSHQYENVSLNEFKEHTYGIGFKLLTNMGYDGKGIGINGQGMTNPI
jgi:hypothetical protein